MAGIYISGMQMPTDDAIICAIRKDGMVEDVMGCYIGKAIPVSDHGDLIERDRAVGELAFDYAYAAADLVKKLPAIIPADKEGEA